MKRNKKKSFIYTEDTFCVPFVITVAPGEVTREGREEIEHRVRDQHVIVNTGKSGHDQHRYAETYNIQMGHQITLRYQGI